MSVEQNFIEMIDTGIQILILFFIMGVIMLIPILWSKYRCKLGCHKYEFVEGTNLGTTWELSEKCSCGKSRKRISKSLEMR